MSNFVHISPEKLLEVVNQCLFNIESYNGCENIERFHYEFSLLKMKRVEKTHIEIPRWTYSGCGIITRLNELKGVAENVIRDPKVIDRDIKLSLTSYNELFKLLNKDKGFEPFVFGNGY